MVGSCPRLHDKGGRLIMYETRFGLRQRPFPATPDSACYYPATGHERALARLQQVLEDGESVGLLTGEPGTGKTLLVLVLLQRLGPTVVSAFVTNSRLRDRAALYQALLYDLSLPYEEAGEQALRLRLTEFLLQNCRAGRRTLLVLDEAQHLPADLLEELRLLGNLEAGDRKAVQVILAGQASLLQTLKQPELAALDQRLTGRAALQPLGVEEAADYVLHHLRRAGARPEAIISDEALEILARHSRGVPRVLNQAARHALVLADAAEAEFVDVEAALEAFALLGIEIVDQDQGEGVGVVAGIDAEESDAACRLYDAPRRVL
jgi:type II secretory pathway predicted ATPase ExeA